MNEHEYAIRSNIARYETLIAGESDQKKLTTLKMLLEAERGDLAGLDKKRR